MLFLFSSHLFWGKISLLLNMVSVGPGFVVPPSSKCGRRLVLVEKENLANREMKASRTSRNKKERGKCLGSVKFWSLGSKFLQIFEESFELL